MTIFRPIAYYRLYFYSYICEQRLTALVWGFFERGLRSINKLRLLNGSRNFKRKEGQCDALDQDYNNYYWLDV